MVGCAKTVRISVHHVLEEDMAGYADPRTTKLYDRRRQKVTRGEVERIRYEKKRTVPGTSEEA